MTESKDPSEGREPNEPQDPFAPGTPPPGWTPAGPGPSWEQQQPAQPQWGQPQWGQPPSEPIGPPQEQIPPHWQQPYGQPPQYGQQPPQYGGGQPPQYGGGQPPPFGQTPYGQGYGRPPLPGIPPGVEIGSLGKRLVARILDSIVLLPVWIVVALATWESGLGGQILGTLVQTAAFFAYDTYFISKRGQTIGKGWMGLRVVLLETGRTPDQTSAAKRAGLYNFSWIACYIGSILVAVSPLFDGTKRKRGWHDKFAGTVVISA